MNKKHAFILITLLLITTIACEVSFGGNQEPSQEDINFELTRTSLQQTQTALAQPPEPEPEESAEPEDQSASESVEEEESDVDDTPCFSSRFTGNESYPDVRWLHQQVTVNIPGVGDLPQMMEQKWDGIL